jgi:hypothetical protein
VEVLAAVVHIERGKAPRALLIVARGQVDMDRASIFKQPTLEVELLYPAMRDSRHPVQLRGLREVPNHEVGVLLPHAIVHGTGTEGIRDHPPIDDQLVLQPCGPIECESGVKETGVPQRRQGHQDACPTPVGELAGDGDALRPGGIVEEVDGEAVDQRRAHGVELLQESLQLGLQVRLRGALEAVPPGRKTRSRSISLLLRHYAVPPQS